jgi:hypothetical protein
MIDALPGDIFQRGQVLNNTYEIEGVLGRGGTGEVYRARNLISGRVVAIKALNKQFSGNDAYVDLMKREEQMRDILHDAVVRYTECSRSDQGHVFLVMDFIDGASVNDIMMRRRMEPRELMIVAHRVAEGLVAAHKRGIVHRDLSPDNIILRDGSPERATIIDFGIAKDTAAGARTIVGNDFAGKYEYAAPEQLEGRAEVRSDLYSLGALLLAAFRGQIPFAGATPGEMVRRKQNPLDTVGVPEPLKGFIDWLTAPKLQERPASAEAVVARLDELLRPAGKDRAIRGGAARGEAGGRKRSLLPLFLLLALIPAVGAGAYYGGLFERFFVEPVPTASPYLFAARSASPAGPAGLSGNAPDAETAERLARAFAAAAEASATPAMLSIAQGMPSETWPASVEALLAATGDLDEWSVALSDRTARIEALAKDRAAQDRVEAAFDAWAAQHGFALTLTLEAGPRDLPAEAVSAALKEVADCGALTPDRPAGGTYGFDDTIRVTGDVASDATVGLVTARLAELIGDRKLSLATTVLNADLCAVRKVLPDVPTNALSIWMADGETLQPNLSGVFRTGQNPVVEIHAPATLTDGTLFVVVVDNTGKVFNILPNVNDEENDLIDLGLVENGVRRIRVLHTIPEFVADNTRLAMQVSEGSYGKSEVVAILSHDDLFAIRRPRDESVASFAEALAEIQKEAPGNIVALASRLLDSRP